ncbi:hypothetical protein RM572_28730, partial [Streptomyces sp. DSM 42041]|nr:hypothetical protein [Streptomyces sp. DSM 42041]
HGHWHARKRQNLRGEIRDQRLASLTPLHTPDQIAEGWAAAEEAAHLGKDTTTSRRLGVRLVNALAWIPQPATGKPAPRPTRRRPPEGDKTQNNQTPHPLPTGSTPQPDEGPGRLDGPLASYADRAEHLLHTLRRTEPRLALPTTDARELAHLAGHYLLRGEGAETIRAVALQGLPPGDIHAPAAFLRHRLLRYLPPHPHWP